MTRHVTKRTCRDCTAEVLVGADADTCGIPVTVDPTRLDQLGEALALISGRATYSMRPAKGDRGQHLGSHLEERTPTVIRDGSRLVGNTIVAQHRCHQPLPEAAEPTARGWATGTDF